MIKAVISNNQVSKCASFLGPGTSDPRSELDYHANMVILEKHFLVIEKTGSTCNVRPFYTELGIAADASIIDVAIAYNYQYKKTT